MNILCCSDRNWTAYYVIEAVLKEYKNQPNITIIHGNANGADRLSAKCAIELGFSVKSFPANWKLYGKAAGPIRNKQMLIEGKPDLVLAFHNYINNSKGTKNMLEIAKKANIPTKLFTE